MSSLKTSPTLIAFSAGDRVASGSPEQAIPDLKRFIGQFPDRNLLVLDAVSSQPVELDLRLSVERLLSVLHGPPANSGDTGSAHATETTGDAHQPEKSGLADSEIDPGISEVNARAPKRPRGRPKLGVVAREVTLLPRHWEWLATQPGGASVALRKLVESARKTSRQTDFHRLAQESAFRFMTSIAGDEAGYEEAVRALYADDLARLESIVAAWPVDVARHAVTLAKSAHTYLE